MARLFLSYSRSDAARVEPIAAALTSAGHDLWWDRKIAGGSEYSGEIEAALDRAEAVVVAWSSNSVRSAWVRDEAAFARDRGRLLPILLDDSGPPLGFRQIHAVDMRNWAGDADAPEFAELNAAIAARAASPGAEPGKAYAPAARAAPSPRSSDPARAKKRRLVIISVFLIAALAICTRDNDEGSRHGGPLTVKVDRGEESTSASGPSAPKGIFIEGKRGSVEILPSKDGKQGEVIVTRRPSKPAPSAPPPPN